MKANKTIDIAGRNSVAVALTSDKQFVNLYVEAASKADPKVQEILKTAQGKNVSIEVVDSEELDKRFETNTQGVVLVVDAGETVTLKQILDKKRDPLILMFNHLDYEQNLGAILRTAWGTGVDAVIANPSGIHEVTPVVSKVSMGGAAFVPLISMSLFQAIDQLKDAAVEVVGVEVGQGSGYYQKDLTKGMALLFGGEAVGISEPLSRRCDSFINIPMLGTLASLNVSVATAIVLFDRLRQKDLV